METIKNIDIKNVVLATLNNPMILRGIAFTAIFQGDWTRALEAIKQLQLLNASGSEGLISDLVEMRIYVEEVARHHDNVSKPL